MNAVTQQSPGTVLRWLYLPPVVYHYLSSKRGEIVFVFESTFLVLLHDGRDNLNL